MIFNKKTGGAGGDAFAEGDDSTAIGGAGGPANHGIGGRGGNAHAVGKKSVAVGGLGGRGGVGPGQAGMDVFVENENTTVLGGQGGEANQKDGRGGRGGRAPLASIVFGIKDHGHIKPSYGRQHTEPGRGGDAPDSAQYMARKLIVMALKERYFFEKGVEPRDIDSVWYDRTVVPLKWVNDTLRIRGYQWSVALDDGEYVFSDLFQY